MSEFYLYILDVLYESKFSILPTLVIVSSIIYLFKFLGAKPFVISNLIQVSLSLEKIKAYIKTRLSQNEIAVFIFYKCIDQT